VEHEKDAQLTSSLTSKTDNAMRDIDLAPYQRMLANGHGIENVLAGLRRDGHSRIESIKILVALRDCSLKEAKKIVHTSDAWTDAQQSAEEFQDSMLSHLDDKTE